MLKKSITRAVLSLGILSLVACDLLDGPPSNDDALFAVRGMMQQALAGSAMPAEFQLASVVVDQCVKQTAPEGHVCNVKLVSKEIPILGAIQIPMQLRFVKKEGKWTAFLS
jgi:hypothetical protein